MALKISKFWFVIASSSALLGGIYYVIPRKNPHSASPETEVTIAKYIESQYPMPVSLSPDFTKLLNKTNVLGRYVLTVTDRKTGKVLSQLDSDESQMSLKWRPDGEAIAYMARKSGERMYSYYLWNLKSQAVVRLELRGSTTALPPLLWTADSRKLAYFSGSSPLGTLNLALLNSTGVVKNWEVAKIRPSSPVAVSDKGVLAFLQSEIPCGFQVYTFQLGIKRSYFLNHEPRPCEVKGLSFSPNGRAALVSVREPDDQFYKIVRVNLESGQRDQVWKKNSDLLNPVWIDDQNFLLEENREGRVEISVLGPIGDRRLKGCEFCVSRIQAVNRHEVASLVSSGEGPQDIRVFNLETQRGETVVSDRRFVRRKGAGAVEIGRTRGEVGVPLILWKPKLQGSSGDGAQGAVLLVHGGPHVQELPTWQPLADLLGERGQLFVVVNYSGSTGYGRSFESVDTLETPVLEIEETLGYLKTRFGIGQKQVILMSESYGARVLTAFARRNSDFPGKVFMVSPFLLPSVDCSQSVRGIAISATHGSNDNYLLPALAKSTLEKCFGLSGLRWDWTVISGEGHVFRSTHALASTYKKVLDLIEEP